MITTTVLALIISLFATMGAFPGGYLDYDKAEWIAFLTSWLWSFITLFILFQVIRIGVLWLEQLH